MLFRCDGTMSAPFCAHVCTSQVDSADVSRSSWMRSQEMAAAEFIAEQMTNEALEVEICSRNGWPAGPGVLHTHIYIY